MTDPACIVVSKKDILGKHHLSYQLVEPSGDGVYQGDHSPPIGTYKFSKPIQSDGKMHVTYALFLSQGETFIDIPNNHNLFTAVNMAFTKWELFGNIKFDRVLYSPTTTIDITLALNNTDSMFRRVGNNASNVMARTYYPNTLTDPKVFTSAYNTDYLWSLDGKTNFADNINQTLLHELGHAIGLVHTQNPQDILYPFYHNALRPTAMDAYQCEVCCGVRTPPLSPEILDNVFMADSEMLEFIDPMPK